MNRSEMRRCGKRYATPEAASRSKNWQQGMTPVACRCGGWHLPKPPASRAGHGSMQAAVTLVLTGQATVAQAARELEVDPERLELKAAAEFRRTCLERDSYTCQECGELATEVQHRVARGMGGTADPLVAFGLANGVSLCAASHRLAEARDEGLHDRGFWLWQTENPAAVPVKVPGPFGSFQSLWLLPNGEVTGTPPSEVAA